MGEKGLIFFIIITSLLLFTFIGGMILFIFQFRKRKIIHVQEMYNMKTEYENEKLLIEINAQKDTMKGIGKEIHDGVGQKLTLASIYLKKQNYKKPEISSDSNLSEINELVDESLSELRVLSRSLVDSEKYNTKLTDLIQLEAKRVKSINGIDVNFNHHIKTELTETVKHNTLRIIQEFLQNSIKHSNCSLIEISLTVENRKLCVVCTDNGIGFDINQEKTPGVGLSNIQKRVADIYGTINFTSVKDKGTTLSFIVDL